MAPGIEVSWSMRNPAVYERPFVIRHRFGPEHYREHGLDPSRDESDSRNPDMGCEPGDLTKRMSPPWQADFYECSQQYTNFTDPTFNQAPVTNIPPPPLYYTYWWPPQSPWNVISGDMTVEEQEASGVAAGYQVPYARGVDNIARLVVAWKYMGFILNQNTSDSRDAYPYFVERERNHDHFVVSSVAVGAPINQLAANGIYPTADNAFHPIWYLKDQGDTAQRRTL
jgi:L-lysine 6-oxidase